MAILLWIPTIEAFAESRNDKRGGFHPLPLLVTIKAKFASIFAFIKPNLRKYYERMVAKELEEIPHKTAANL